jgi:hypothetical protein
LLVYLLFIFSHNFPHFFLQTWILSLFLLITFRGSITFALEGHRWNNRIFSPEEAPEKPRRGCWIPVVLFLIVALLGSSVYSVVWFAFLRDREPDVVVIDVTATPDPDDGADDLPDEDEYDDAQPII